MKALVFGTTGQVAIEIARNAPLVGMEIEALDRVHADLTDPAACAALVTATDADIVINAAAYTAVDAAESDLATAQLVNADAPGAMARAAATRGLPFLHVSTDYVFDGAGARPWEEGDAVAPLGAYGATKLDGERQVTAAGGPHVILRTAWVFSAHGKNFVKTMLRLGAEREALSVVDDQRGGPTPAHEIAKALIAIGLSFHEGRGQSGIFHFAGGPACSWADFAEAIFAASSIGRKPTVRRITTAEFPTPARRPANSVLNCTKIRDIYSIGQPDWRTGLKTVIRELESEA
ncbi:dTDP-4-dehydrorhamnose reductase [Frigidibacter sp. SD6-1]|uniref:dTDP-4-dehydrorhamnose reductase n=1 Tax=Frigidibacter sp. SD6-1 TaxID=3032581 RepID=UPI0024DF89C7|nr:dTDP-4-dehydrorhamnose reductase [Frigidibacter sp. SD6-1]